MNDMRAVIIPKSDQINADDLLGGPMTITVSKVTIRPGTEQPVSIHFDGDNGKPYKPCKSMARVMVTCWGPDANQYTGRSMTLYCDPKVMWGGLAVGGIRISHMSHISGTQVMALTATKGSRKPFTVNPLVQQAASPAATTESSAPSEQKARRPTTAEWLDALQADLNAAETAEAVDAVLARPGVLAAQQKLTNGALDRLNAMAKDALDRTAPLPTDDDFPGDRPSEAA